MYIMFISDIYTFYNNWIMCHFVVATGSREGGRVKRRGAQGPGEATALAGAGERSTELEGMLW